MNLFERPWCNKAPTQDIATINAVILKLYNIGVLEETTHCQGHLSLL